MLHERELVSCSDGMVTVQIRKIMGSSCSWMCTWLLPNLSSEKWRIWHYEIFLFDKTIPGHQKTSFRILAQEFHSSTKTHCKTAIFWRWGSSSDPLARNASFTVSKSCRSKICFATDPWIFLATSLHAWEERERWLTGKGRELKMELGDRLDSHQRGGENPTVKWWG